MTARVFKIENKLAKKVQLPGGRTVAEAVATASRKVEGLREASVASLDAQIAKIAALAAEGRKSPDAALADLYRISGEVFGVAGAFGLEPLAQAAYGLCDLVDAFRAGAEPSWPAITVHADALKLLAGPNAPDPEGVLAGLQAVRLRYVEA